MALYYYLTADSPCAEGPVEADSPEDAEYIIRHMWQMEEDEWVEVWEITRQSIAEIVENNQRIAADIPGGCAALM